MGKTLVILGLLLGAIAGLNWMHGRGYLRLKGRGDRKVAQAPVATPMAQTDTDPIVKGDPAAPDARLKDIPLACADGKCTLKVTIKAFKRCLEGDAETITSDLHFSASKRLLLTLEQVRKDGTVVAPTRVLKKDEYFTGFTHEFTFPQRRRREVLGVFLCKDDERSGRCFDKVALPTRESLLELSEASTNKNFQARDKTYYFAPVFAGVDVVSIAADEDKMAPVDAWKSRLDFVKATGREKDQGPLAEGVLRSSALVQILTNFPLRAEGDGVTIPMPYLDFQCLMQPQKK